MMVHADEANHRTIYQVDFSADVIHALALLRQNFVCDMHSCSLCAFRSNRLSGANMSYPIIKCEQEADFGQEIKPVISATVCE